MDDVDKLYHSGGVRCFQWQLLRHEAAVEVGVAGAGAPLLAVQGTQESHRSVSSSVSVALKSRRLVATSSVQMAEEYCSLVAVRVWDVTTMYSPMIVYNK